MKTCFSKVQENPPMLFSNTHIVKQLSPMVGNNFFYRLQFYHNIFVIKIRKREKLS